MIILSILTLFELEVFFFLCERDTIVGFMNVPPSCLYIYFVSDMHFRLGRQGQWSHGYNLNHIFELDQNSWIHEGY